MSPAEDSKHDYEPGWPETSRSMHSDPLCAVCGAPKTAAVHR